MGRQWAGRRVATTPAAEDGSTGSRRFPRRGTLRLRGSSVTFRAPRRANLRPSSGKCRPRDGAEPLALDGATLLARLVEHASGRIVIMAGSGLSPERVGPLLALARVDEIHASCRSPCAMPDDDRLPRFGFQGGTLRTDRSVILSMLARIAEANASVLEPMANSPDRREGLFPGSA